MQQKVGDPKLPGCPPSNVYQLARGAAAVTAIMGLAPDLNAGLARVSTFEITGANLTP